VILLPIIVKARGNDSTSDLIRKFKKIVAGADIVQKVKDRTYYQKPSQEKQVRKNELRRAHKRLRSLKRSKNVAAEDIERLVQALS